jgi:hypothetical protein
MSTEPDTRPGAQRAAVPFPPPIGQTPVDGRLPHRVQPGWLEAARDHLEAGREWLAQQGAEERASNMWEWDGPRGMDDDELDDRP